MAGRRALECLVAVADEGSVTAAGRRLGTTQSALSHQLAALERDLGVVLLERHRGGTRLTTAGRAVLPQARAVLAAHERFEVLARQASGQQAGRLRISCAQSVTTGLLPRVLRRWHRARPEVGIELTEVASSDRMVDAVRTGEVDLAVGPRPGELDGLVTVLGWEPIVVALGTHDPLVRHSTITRDQLAGRRLVLYDRDHGMASWVTTWFAGAARQPEAAVRTAQTGAVAVLAATGIGPGLVPATSVPPRYDGVLRPLRPAAGREILAVRPHDRDPLVELFVQDLRAHAGPAGLRPRGPRRLP